MHNTAQINSATEIPVDISEPEVGHLEQRDP